MSGLATSIGLISGIDIGNLVEQLISLQRLPAVRMEQRAESLQATQGGLGLLEAKLLTLTNSISKLNQVSTFNTLTASNSDKAQIKVSTNASAVPGNYQFQALRTAATHEVISKGFANTDTQKVGAGTLTIATGGRLERPTLLSALNGGEGVRRGVIRITDRSGQSADVDLTSAFSVSDVVDAINNADVSVVARTDGESIVLEDTSGSTAAELSVVDLNGGHAAEDLGIDQSVSADELTGDSIFTLTGDFTLDQLNDGNSVKLLRADGDEDEDLTITLSDDTVLEIDLDDAATINEVLDTINNHADNGGKLTATLTDGGFELTDNSGGGNSFTVEDANNASVVEALGLDSAAVGNTITGARLLAGMNSVLLRNVHGGQGIDQTGQITLTDRTGSSATIDLTGAESLDEVINAINSAEDGGTALTLVARINDVGTGIEISDTSGSTASNLIIADVGGSTLAEQLGIEFDDAVDAVDSGALGRRYVNEATEISDYAPDGGGIADGSLTITNSNGEQVTVEISSTAETIGDVLQRINTATAAVAGFNVTAELNTTGDGFTLVDTAGGGGTLEVTEVDSTTAADLRILGTGTDAGGSTQELSSRRATIVGIDAEDTLDDVVAKINEAGPLAVASVFDDGSAFNTKRLRLNAADSGSDARLIVDDGGLGLGFSVQTEGADALLRVGANAETGFLLASGTNAFDDAVTGLDVDVLAPGETTAQVTVSLNSGKIEDALQSFIDGYNSFVDATAELTQFNPETLQRGVLQGEGVVLRILGRLDSLIGRQSLNPDDGVRSLADLGVRVGVGGKLSVDTGQLQDVLAADADAVAEFFLIKDADDPADFGFAEVAQQTIDSFTDPFTGSLILEKDALQASVDSIFDRVEQLDEILLIRRERLIREFINMENALGLLTSQQQAISSIAPLRINRVGQNDSN